MEKEFVTYKQALALKELGFDEPCFGYYVDGGLRGVNLGIEELGGVKPYYERFGFHTINNHHIDNKNKIVVSSPLYQQAFRWFRDKHKLDGWVTPYYSFKGKLYSFLIENGKEENLKDSDEDYKSHEEAESACIDKLIEICKTK